MSALVVLLAALGVAQGARMAKRAEIQAAHGELEAAVGSHVAYLESELGRLDLPPELLAGAFEIAGLFQDGAGDAQLRDANLYLELFNDTVGASVSYVMDTSGLTLAASNWRSEGSFVGENYRFRPYFAAALGGGKGHYVAVGVTSGELGYYVSAPIRIGAEVVGIAVVKYPIDDIIASAWPSGSARIFIADSDGVIFASNDRWFLFHTLAPIEPDVLNVVRKNRQYPGDAALVPLPLSDRRDVGAATVVRLGVRRIESETEGQDAQATALVQIDDVTGEDHVAERRYLPGANWTILALTNIEGRTSDLPLIGGLGALVACLTILLLVHLDQRRASRLALEASEGRLRERVAELETARCNLEEQRRRLVALANDLAVARDTAEEATRAKSAFLANMSHELRTPLNAIIGFAEVIESESLGPGAQAKYREYVSDIHASGRHLLRVINDILDLSKIEAGRADLDETEWAPEALVTDCVRVMRERARAAGVSLMVSRGGDETVALRLWADERKLKQTLLNLVSNAVKFTPPGGLVTVSAEPDGQGRFLFKVADTGFGMRPEDIPIALEPFRQVEGSLARRHEGTGLGLSLARAFAELHGGTIAIDSEVGHGTTVTVALPQERIRGAVVAGSRNGALSGAMKG